MLKLRHNWGQAYEYLSEFNKYSRILNLDERSKKLILSWQVKPSVREALYDLPGEKQSLEEDSTRSIWTGKMNGSGKRWSDVE